MKKYHIIRWERSKGRFCASFNTPEDAEAFRLEWQTLAIKAKEDCEYRIRKIGGE